ncbi:MAG: 2-oxoacid:acceptor oxidoreductase family protein [Bacillota bacterium]
MLEEVLIAGFGGQGILSTGQLLACAGMREGLHVAWIPSYGPEMRGGTANCGVTLSDAEISSPLVTEPNVLIAMNGPSLEKYGSAVGPGGVILYNSSLVKDYRPRPGVLALGVDANRVAERIGSVRVAANVVLGAYIGLSGVISVAAAVAALKEVLPVHRHKLIPANQRALEQGAALGAAIKGGPAEERLAGG